MTDTTKLKWTPTESLGSSDYRAEYDGWRFRARKSYRGGLWLVDGWRDGRLAFSDRCLTFSAVRRVAEEELANEH